MRGLLVLLPLLGHCGHRRLVDFGSGGIVVMEAGLLRRVRPGGRTHAALENNGSQGGNSIGLNLSP